MQHDHRRLVPSRFSLAFLWLLGIPHAVKCRTEGELSDENVLFGFTYKQKYLHQLRQTCHRVYDHYITMTFEESCENIEINLFSLIFEIIRNI